MMSDLIEFLSARIAEDEAAARAWLPLGNPDDAQREHIARLDPGRVLRQVEASRIILGEHPRDDVETDWCGRCQVDTEREYWVGKAFPCPTLLALALPYADHPDYDPAWRP